MDLGVWLAAQRTKLTGRAVEPPVARLGPVERRDDLAVLAEEPVEVGMGPGPGAAGVEEPKAEGLSGVAGGYGSLRTTLEAVARLHLLTVQEAARVSDLP